jgi:hypothetical protein
LVSSAASTTRLFVLLCLAAWLAPLGRRITALAEKFLVVAGKRKYLSAVAASKLQIVSHISLSSLPLLGVAFRKKAGRKPPLAVLSVSTAAHLSAVAL